MYRMRLLAIGLAAFAALCPSNGYGMERAAMDQLLALSHEQSADEKSKPPFRVRVYNR